MSLYPTSMSDAGDSGPDGSDALGAEARAGCASMVDAKMLGCARVSIAANSHQRFTPLETPK